MKSFALFGITVLALSAFQAANALDCYVCGGPNGFNGCENLAYAKVVNCRHSCITVTTDYHIERLCAPSTICTTNDFGNNYRSCTPCYDDLCNGSQSLGFNAVLLFVLLGAIVMQQVRGYVGNG